MGAAVLAALGLGAAPALAAPKVTGKLASGPAAAGAKGLWIERRADRSLVVRTGGRRVSTLLTLPVPTAGADNLARDLIASPLAYSFGRISVASSADGANVLFERYGGLLGRPAAVVAGCVAGGGLDGTQLAYAKTESCGPDPDNGKILIRDLASGVQTALGPVPGLRGGVRIAGPFVAFVQATTGGPFTALEPQQLVVFDTRSSQTAYTVPVPAGGQYDYDLQADGKLALESFQNGRLRVAWYSPAEASPHPLPQVARSPTIHEHRVDVRMAGDRILFDRKRPGGGELTLASLDGELTRLVRFDGRNRRLGGIDWDGTRVAWASSKRRRLGGRVKKLAPRVYLKRPAG